MEMTIQTTQEGQPADGATTLVVEAATQAAKATAQAEVAQEKIEETQEQVEVLENQLENVDDKIDEAIKWQNQMMVMMEQMSGQIMTLTEAVSIMQTENQNLKAMMESSIHQNTSENPVSVDVIPQTADATNATQNETAKETLAENVLESSAEIVADLPPVRVWL